MENPLPPEITLPVGISSLDRFRDLNAKIIIAKWGNRDEAFTQVVQAIRRAAQTLRRSRSVPTAAESGGAGQSAAGPGHLGSWRPRRLVGIGRMNVNKLIRAAGATAGIGGIAIAAMIILYRDILRAQYLPTLTPQHAVFIIGAIVLCVFFITVLGLYTWLSNQGDTWIAQRAWIFLLIITLILASSLVGIYMLRPAGTVVIDGRRDSLGERKTPNFTWH